MGHMGHIPKGSQRLQHEGIGTLKNVSDIFESLCHAFKMKIEIHPRRLPPQVIAATPAPFGSIRENLRKIQGIGANPEPPLLRGLLLLLGLGERLSSVGCTFLHCIFQKVLQGSPNLTSFVYLFTNSAFIFVSFQVHHDNHLPIYE